MTGNDNGDLDVPMTDDLRVGPRARWIGATFVRDQLHELEIILSLGVDPGTLPPAARISVDAALRRVRRLLRGIGS